MSGRVKNCESYLEEERPTKLSDIAGNEEPKRRIQKRLAAGFIRPGFGFYGDYGAGKTTVARCLVRAILCEDRQPAEIDPCEDCAHCRACIGSLVEMPFDCYVRNCADYPLPKMVAELTREMQARHDRPFVLLLDEFHMATPEFQTRLTTYMDDRNLNLVLVICTPMLRDGAKDIVLTPLRQRLACMKVTAPIREQMVTHLTGVAIRRQFNPTEEAIRGICAENNDNPRDCLNALFDAYL